MLPARNGYTLYQAHVARHPKKILVADDDADMRRLLATRLRGDGYQIIECSDGEGVLEYLAGSMMRPREHDAPDIVVCDIRMPGVSGLELLAVLRQFGARVPVILMSAFDDEITRGEAKRLGARALFHKPFDLDDLGTLILNLAVA